MLYLIKQFLESQINFYEHLKFKFVRYWILDSPHT